MARLIGTEDAELAWYYMTVAEEIGATIGATTNSKPLILTSDDENKPGAEHVKKAFETEPAYGAFPSDRDARETYGKARTVAYGTHRADFPEGEGAEGENLPHSRREPAGKVWDPAEEGDYSGGAERRASGRRYLGVRYERGGGSEPTGGISSVRPSQRFTNRADEDNDSDLPFSAGPSGTMAYTLSAFDAAGPKANRDLFAVSLAVYLVRNQHHSLFEALVPLRPKADTTVEFYRWIVDLLVKHGKTDVAKSIAGLIDEHYPPIEETSEISSKSKKKSTRSTNSNVT